MSVLGSDQGLDAMVPELGHCQLPRCQRHRDQLDDDALHLASPGNGLLSGQAPPVPLIREQPDRRNRLADRALACDRGVEVALWAVTLPMTSSANPPRTDAVRQVNGTLAVGEFGDDCALVAGLDLEPHSITQRENSLRSPGIALLRHRLGDRDGRVVYLIERRTEIRQRNAEVTEAALGRTHAGRV